MHGGGRNRGRVENLRIGGITFTGKTGIFLEFVFGRERKKLKKEGWIYVFLTRSSFEKCIQRVYKSDEVTVDRR